MKTDPAGMYPLLEVKVRGDQEQRGLDRHWLVGVAVEWPSTT
jgi:hypothetical protein